MSAQAAAAACPEGRAIVVTGAAGFIGSHTCEFLLNRGEHVVGIDEVNDYYDVRVKSRMSRLERVGGDRFTFYRGDICDVALLDRVWTGHGKPRRVVHMAARAGVRPTQRQLLRPSSSVYGGSKETLFSEKDSVDFPVSPYAATKKACELLAYTYHHLYKLNIAALRFFTVFGPRGRPDMAPLKFVDKISRGAPIQQFGDGSSSRDYTYVDDVVQGIVLSLDTPLGYQVYNLGNGSPTKLGDFIALVEEATGRKAEIEILPEQPGDVPRTCADISKARELLGYDPKTPFPEGIRKLVAWYNETHPEVGQTPECVEPAAMERRLRESAARKAFAVDEELLLTFRAAQASRPTFGRDRASTIGRSDPSKMRPRMNSSSFDDLTKLGVALTTDDVPSPHPRERSAAADIRAMMSSAAPRAMSSDDRKTRKDWSSAALLLAPSVIMHVMVVVLHTAVPANLVFHAFMVGAILAHGWSLRLGANALRHR
ncbi:racemase/epimerase [Aureococcus anophagefferens]|nr:racemase/epimerase [Aureococcus anophagefferens]